MNRSDRIRLNLSVDIDSDTPAIEVERLTSLLEVELARLSKGRVRVKRSIALK